MGTTGLQISKRPWTGTNVFDLFTVAKSLIVLVVTLISFVGAANAQDSGYTFRGIAATIEEFDSAFHLKKDFDGQVDVQIVTQSAYIDH